MKPTDFASFIKVVGLSQLIGKESLSVSAKEFYAKSKFFIDDYEEMTSFADLLVERNLLTRWQSDHLLAGKHRGFFLETYVLQDRIRTENLSTVYAGRDLKTGRNVVLRIFPRSRITENRDFVIEVISEEGPRRTST